MKEDISIGSALFSCVADGRNLHNIYHTTNNQQLVPSRSLGFTMFVTALVAAIATMMLAPNTPKMRPAVFRWLHC